MMQSRRDFVRTLFVATQATLVGTLLPGNLFAADAKSGGLNFLVFGDWGRNGEKDQHDVAVQMGIAAEEIGAKFVISVGDNFYENGVASVDDHQWQTSFEKVYTAPSLQVPWQVILGNHDYHGNCEAQIAYSHVSHRWNMPARYYTRTERIDAQNAVDFFYLDSTPMAKWHGTERIFSKNLAAQDIDHQLAWFKAALEASTAPWKIVVAHHPVYSGGEHGDTPYIIKHILPLLQEHKVQAYFNGHDHDLQHLQAGTVNLFCCGAGSKVRPTKTTPHSHFAQSCSGFVTVALQAEQLAVRMIDDHGKLVYTATVPRVAV